MAKADRIQLIRAIERARKTRVITYVTSTRQNLEVSMAIDSIRYIYDHLELIARARPPVRKIDLFLHSNGGDGIVPWRLVTLIREYAEHFSVLVPHRAFSAATLTALGADTIVMHPMGMLGPTDPTVTNAFNPLDPSGKRIGISVEDVTAYLALMRDDAGIHHEDQVVSAFNQLAANVHPLALGNVKRSLSQSRMMAKKLLSLHMDPDDQSHRVQTIVDNLTSKLFYHGHPINRTEAAELGLSTVSDPPRAVERAMWNLYLQYEAEMKMNVPFDTPMEFVAEFPAQVVGAQDIGAEREAKICYIESADSTDVCSMKYRLSGQKLPNHSTSVTMITTERGWRKE